MGRSDLTKQKILDAALIEFGDKGFALASTNAIYVAAGVSKGTVFKYYPTKADLFYAVFAREVDTMLLDLEPVLSSLENDVFEKVMEMTFAKALYAREHPHATRLLMDAIARPPESIRSRLVQHISDLTRLSVQLLFRDLPMEHIRPEFSKEDVFRNMEIAMNGLQATYVRPTTSLEQLEMMKESSIAFLKAVLRGMEENHERH